MHYSLVKPSCSNFRVITANFWGVRIFRIFTVMFTMACSQVGDIVKVYMKKAFPCDLVMLSSHDIEGNCYINTANLDGETNLKVFG